MAKNTVKIDIDVDDNGTTKKVGLDAKKTGKGLDDVANSSRNAQKGIKGVAGTASAGGKNFAGMSRGMGGLVGAYAAFAAQMFALTAAFGFLKRAGDLSVMQAGQVTYASATGVAMRTLTSDIIAATGAQITFRDAAGAVAIGTAAGVTTDQLKRLGKAAKDTSAVLGRDVTDSFNRLIRGVTKAEPELLDELGIILRLDTASRNYAQALGKNVEDLSQFEKSQAVVNEVLSQSESKYSRIQDIMGGSQANPFAQLGKAFDDIIMLIQEKILPLMGALAKVLTEVPLLAIAGFGLLAKGPLAAMGFSLDGLVTKMNANHIAAEKTWTAAKLGAMDANAAVKIYTASLQKQTIAAMASKDTPNVGGSSIMKKVAGGTALSKKELSQLQNSLTLAKKKLGADGKVISGIFKGFTSEALIAYERMVDGIKVANKKLAVDTKVTTKGVSYALAWMGNAATAAAAKIGAALMTMMSWAGWISIAVMALMMLKDAFIKPKELTKTEQAFEDLGKKVRSLTEDYKNLVKVQKIMTEDGSYIGLTSIGSALGNIAGSVNRSEFQDITEQIMNVTQARIDFVKATNELAAQHLESKGMMQKAFDWTMDSIGLGGDGAAGDRKTRGGASFAETLADTKDPKGIHQSNLKFIQDQIDLTRIMTKEYGKYKVVADYHHILLQVNAGLYKGTPQAAEAARVAMMELGAEFRSLEELGKKSATAMAGQVSSFAPKSADFRAIQDFKKEIAALEKTRAQEGRGQKGNFTPVPGTRYRPVYDTRNKAEKEQDAKLELLQRELKWVTQIGIERQAQKVQAGEANQAMVEASSVREVTQKKIDIAAAGELKKLAEMEVHNVNQRAYDEFKLEKFGEITDEMENAEVLRKQSLTTMGLELVEMGKKKQLMIETQEVEKKINRLKVDQAHAQKEKQILSLLQKQFDIKKRTWAITKSQADRELERSIRAQTGRGGLLRDEAGIRAKKEAEYARKMLDKTLEEGGTKARIVEEFAIKKKIAENENTLQDIKFKLLDGQMALEVIRARNLQFEMSILSGKNIAAANAGMIKDPMDARGEAKIDTPASAALRKLGTDQATTGANATKDIAALTKLREMLSGLMETMPDGVTILEAEQVEALAKAVFHVESLEDKAKNLSSLEVHLKELGENIRTSMEGAFTAMVTGAKSAKAAFADMAMSILSQMAQMLVQMMLLQMFQGSTFGTFLGMGKGRTGGVFNQGQKIQGYATGGVARGSTSGYPTMLHGTEAVVPLPNGRSIPVEMKDSGGTNNNIVVNISTDGQSSKEGSSGPDMDKLGGAIATAVQVELQNQKRSGGILNPYGVA